MKRKDEPAGGTSQLLDHIGHPPSAENPQAPETLDASTPKVDVSSFSGLLGDDDTQEVMWVDPDRPPISQSDQRKLKNQLKSKAKKYVFRSYT